MEDFSWQYALNFSTIVSVGSAVPQHVKFFEENGRQIYIEQFLFSICILLEHFDHTLYLYKLFNEW